MKLLLRSLFLFAATLHAQTALPKYAVVKTENGEAFLASLNQLADQGYRVLAISKYAVLRLEAAPPNTYRYRRIEVKGGPAQFTNWINDQGAHGYRWLAHTGLLEKAPHPHNYEYRVAPRRGLGPARNRDLSLLVEQGYRQIDPISFSHSLGAPTHEVFFERDLDAPTPPPVAYPGTMIAVADAMRADNVMKQVDGLSRKGYRVVGPHDSDKGGGIALMLEKCRDDCSGRYEYRYFDAKNAAQVENDLNTLGKDGFRVLPAALIWRPHVLERDTRAKQAFTYRALDPTDADNLAQLLNAAGNEGFAPLEFVWHAGFASAQGFLIIEKETTASAAP
jgi:hypothetical protein